MSNIDYSNPTVHKSDLRSLEKYISSQTGGNPFDQQENIKIGLNAGLTAQGTNGIAIGKDAGTTNQSNRAIAIGLLAGNSGQLNRGIAIGSSAGRLDQQGANIAIGPNAAEFTQGQSAIAIGNEAAQNSQGGGAIAIGEQAAETNQGANSVAIGRSSGQNGQELSAVAIGSLSGQTTQREGAIAIGWQTGRTNQGAYSVAVGALSGYQSQAANSIALNATAQELNPSNTGFFVKPVREMTANNLTFENAVYYSPTSGELAYKPLFVSTPAAPTSNGDANQFAIDSNHLYVCVAHNQWKRINLDTWTPPTPPTQPQNLQGTPGNQSVSLTWVAPSNPGTQPITNYQIERSADGGTTFNNQVQVGNVLATTIGSLTNNVAYVFRVRAVNSVGAGSWSDNSPSLTPIAPPANPPDQITIFTADYVPGNPNQVQLSWNAPASDGPILEYDVEYQRSGPGFPVLNQSVSGTATTVIIGSLTPYKYYGFKIRARNGAGWAVFNTTVQTFGGQIIIQNSTSRYGPSSSGNGRPGTPYVFNIVNTYPNNNDPTLFIPERHILGTLNTTDGIIYSRITAFVGADPGYGAGIFMVMTNSTNTPVDQVGLFGTGDSPIRSYNLPLTSTMSQFTVGYFKDYPWTNAPRSYTIEFWCVPTVP